MKKLSIITWFSHDFEVILLTSLCTIKVMSKIDVLAQKIKKYELEDDGNINFGAITTHGVIALLILDIVTNKSRYRSFSCREKIWRQKC